MNGDWNLKGQFPLQNVGGRAWVTPGAWARVVAGMPVASTGAAGACEQLTLLGGGLQIPSWEE